MAEGGVAPSAAGALRRLAVAFSGGRDSTALLHTLWRAATALEEGVIELHALHVHHGLQSAADDWLKHCRRQVSRWTARGAPIHFHHRHLRLQPQPGESLEAVARAGRYDALAEMAREALCEHVLLAQHADDQAETFLLQALRGGGPAGLASMPREIERDGIVWLRPWLKLPRRAIDGYVRRHRLSHVEDGSNLDPRFARNRLRHQVWPALEVAFPSAAASLGAAARRAQEAQVCLEALARLDLQAAALDGGGLRVSVLLALGGERARNALRTWLQDASDVLGQAPTAALIERLSREITSTGARRWSLTGGVWVECSRGVLRRAQAQAQDRSPDAPGASMQEGRPSRLMLQRPGVWVLPGWGGALHVQEVDRGGLPWARLSEVELRSRGGGETFQGEVHRPARSLKKQFQQAGVPAWSRQGPLLYDLQGRLLFVPGLGVDARCFASAGEPQARLDWEPLGPAVDPPPRGFGP